MHLAGPVLPLIYLAALVAADTEIINFRGGQTVSRALSVVEFLLVLIQTIARNMISHTHVHKPRPRTFRAFICHFHYSFASRRQHSSDGLPRARRLM